MFRRSLCALTVVTFAACTDNRSSVPETNSDDDANAAVLPAPPSQVGAGRVDSPTPSESTNADEGVGPGLILIETNPTVDPAPKPAIPVEDAPPTPEQLP